MDGGSALVAAVDARQAAALALLEQLVNLDAGTFAQAWIAWGRCWPRRRPAAAAASSGSPHRSW
jgi:hypothetical protein